MSEGKSNDDDTDGTKTSFSSSSLIINQFLAGGLSGLLSRAATHPVDTIKSQMQVSNLVVKRRSTERSGCGSTSHHRPILPSTRLLNAKCDTKPVQRFRGSRSWCADGERDVFSRVRDDEEDAEEDIAENED